MVKDVKNSAKTLLLAAVCTTQALTGRGEIKGDGTSAQAYPSISDRNIFALVAEDPHDHAKPLPPPTNAKLTGITTVLGVKQAMFIVNEPAAEGKPARPHSVMLCEGQSFAKLEVLQINPEARNVKVRNDDTESLLCFRAVEARK